MGMGPRHCDRSDEYGRGRGKPPYRGRTEGRGGCGDCGNVAGVYDESQCQKLLFGLEIVDWFSHKFLVRLVGSRKFERIRDRRLALLHARDHVRAAEPMRFGEIGLRPLRGMVGVRMVEADDVFSAGAAFALDADEFLGMNVVAVMRRVLASVAGGDYADDRLRSVVGKMAQHHTTTLVRISLLPMPAHLVVRSLIKSQHLQSRHKPAK